MEETIQFIYQVIREHRVNIGGQINDMFRRALIAQQSPVIQNNLDQAFDLLANQGVFEEREQSYFLTELGFNTIYNL